MKLPAELFDYRRWVLWRIAEVDGRKTKLPISPWSGKLASCDKPQTWSSYKHVRFALRRRLSASFSNSIVIPRSPLPALASMS
jgi:primase-polymerase (primpol)-like protein